MSRATITEPDFSLSLPEGDWTNHPTTEAYEFRCGNHEQVIVASHVARNPFTPSELEAAVIELFRVRLESVQTNSGDSCTFESPACYESSGRFDVSVFGHDLRQRVYMQFGFFGTSKKVIAVSYYDYSGAAAPDGFKQRAEELLSSVSVS